MTSVKVGQIWKDNDDRGPDRYIIVEIIGADRAQIRRVHRDGSEYNNSRSTWTDKSRFGRSSRNGFSFVREA